MAVKNVHACCGSTFMYGLFVYTCFPIVCLSGYHRLVCGMQLLRFNAIFICSIWGYHARIQLLQLFLVDEGKEDPNTTVWSTSETPF